MSAPLLYAAAFNMVDLESYTAYGKEAYPVLITSQNIRELMDAIRYGAVRIAVERAFQNAITPRRMAITLVVSRFYNSTEAARTHWYTIDLQHIKTFRDAYIRARRTYIHSGGKVS